MRVPVPPITIGIFFLADWIAFSFFLEFVLVKGATPKYYFACTEIYEFITSLILLVISMFFLLNRQWLVLGSDIKEQLKEETNEVITPFIRLKVLRRLISSIF
jgi:hypothetical protein